MVVTRTSLTMLGNMGLVGGMNVVALKKEDSTSSGEGHDKSYYTAYYNTTWLTQKVDVPMWLILLNVVLIVTAMMFIMRM